jgi:pimeloyl-ACP methyl ester carboxylesterase
MTAAGVDVIGQAVRWLAKSAHSSSRRVALLGFSFAGGLSLVAAADRAVSQSLSRVVSVGGHHDLARVLEFLMTDVIATPRGLRRANAHDYGLVILAYGELARFVEEPDLARLRIAFRAWLEEDRARARAAASRRVTEAGGRIFLLLERRRLRELAPTLRAALAERAHELAALSPRGSLGQIDVPVHLLHGAADNVIPPSETEWADLELGAAPHRTLISPLLDHVEISGRFALGAELALLDFLSELW